MTTKFRFLKYLSNLKSLGPIDRKFHGHGENHGIILLNNSVVFANIPASAL